MNENPILDILIKAYPNFASNGRVANEIWDYVNDNYVTWHEIMAGELPEGEVLAGNFAPGTTGFKDLLMGWLGRNGNVVYCDNDHDFLYNVTHYIPIRDIDLYPNRLP